MKKLVVLMFIILGLLSCGDKKAEEVKEDNSMALVDLKKLPKKVNPSEGATLILRDWTEYNAINSAMNAIYNTDTKEDLTVIVEDLIEKQKLLETSVYPEVFNRADIKSRQKVFKTYVLKIKSNMEYDINPRAAVIEMVKAYNAFNNQFSVVISSTLDSELLFDE
tara:strand:- start:12677 stop:13171 length:495 start_codon:yes stop_codon:yes gene_type:complete